MGFVLGLFYAVGDLSYKSRLRMQIWLNETDAMEFLDEDARPRFRPVSSPLSSTPSPQKPINKIFLIITVSLSSILLALSILFIQTEPFRSLLIWLAFSFILGPFAPSHLTGGDIRVGRGPILEPAPIGQEPDVSAEKQGRKRRSARPVRLDEIAQNPVPSLEKSNGFVTEEGKIEALGKNGNGSVRIEEEKEWNVEDMEILKKQMVKNPVGKPRRWEVIAEAFNGRHRVESVVKMAKELGEKKSSDSFAQFLKNRKPMDARIQGESDGIETKENGGDGDGGMEWSSGEDIALLNALKVFPKDVAMRWEKISAAVPGKSKAACMKRVAVLKKDFRSSKAGAES